MATKKKNAATCTHDDARRRGVEQAAERIRRALGLETLADRGRDALDFHDIPVAGLRRAIAIAFDAGFDAGFDAARTLHR